MGHWIHQFLDQIGIWSIFWFAFIGPYLFPAAGELAVFLAAAVHSNSLTGIMLIGTAGAIASDQLAFGLGFFLGRKLLAKKVSEERRLRLERKLDKNAPVALITMRMVTGARTWLAVLCGAGKLSHWKFTIYNTIGCVIWAITFVALGRAFGETGEAKHLIESIEKYSLAIFLVLTVVLWGPFVWGFIKERTIKSRE